MAMPSRLITYCVTPTSSVEAAQARQADVSPSDDADSEAGAVGGRRSSPPEPTTTVALEVLSAESRAATR
jgi:hypothetical protein